MQRFHYTQSNCALMKGTQLGRQDVQTEVGIWCESSYCCNHRATEAASVAFQCRARLWMKLVSERKIIWSIGIKLFFFSQIDHLQAQGDVMGIQSHLDFY